MDLPHASLGTTPAPEELRSALSVARRGDRGGRSETTPADLAALYMLAGRYEPAISLLNRARPSSRPAGRARILNDLSAALLLRGSQGQDPYDLVLALEANSEALRLDPALPEALFNRAVILEAFFARQAAIGAWRSYLAAVDEPAWRAEAEESIDHLSEASKPGPETPSLALLAATIEAAEGAERLTEIVAGAPAAWRRFFEDELLGAWADGVVDGSGAERELEAQAGSLASALERRSGDRFPVAVVDSLAHAQGQKRLALAHGHRLYREGILAYRESAFEVASAAFAAAIDELAAGESAFGVLSRLQAAKCHLLLKRFDAAEEILTAVTAEAESARFLALAGQAHWAAGLLQSVVVNPLQAAEHYERAGYFFSVLGEGESLAAVESLAAGNLHVLGRDKEAWIKRHHALELVVASGDPERISIILGDAARSMSVAGDPSGAELLQGEALHWAERAGDEVAIVQAQWWRAIILQKSGRSADSLETIAAASRLVDDLASPGAREHLQAGLKASRGVALLAESPEAAIESLTEALSYFRGHAYEYLTTEILLQRGRAHLRIGATLAAEDDFDEGIEEYERQRHRMQGAPQRVEFFDRAESVFDEMIDLQVDIKGDVLTGLAYADRSRARALLDDLDEADRGGEWWPSDLLDGAAGADTAVLAFHAQEERLLAWSLFEGHLEFRSLPIGREELGQLVSRVRRAMEQGGGGGDGARATMEAHEKLIAPLLDAFRGASRLVIVPSAELSALPFAAAQVNGGEYLFESYEIVVAPSLAIYSTLGARARGAEQVRTGKALILGNPRLEETPGDRALPPLPGAVIEAGRIGELYEGSTVLTGEQARRGAFLQQAGEADLLHLAVHAVSGHPASESAVLHLAADAPGEDGVLDARALAALNLTRAPLVVLSACSAADGPLSSLEGRLNLARPFLAAGARAVMAPLWDVDDERAASFLVAFHRHYVELGGAGAALRAAQLEAVADPGADSNSFSVWAAFQVIGR